MTHVARTARALRIAAGAVMVLFLARQLAGGLPSSPLQRRLLLLRSGGVVALALLAWLCGPRRSLRTLRALALLMGAVGLAVVIGIMILDPAAAWEQAVMLVALILGGALIPWPWPWQAALAGLILAAATLAVAAVAPQPGLSGEPGIRFLVTLVVLAAASVVGTALAERARRQVLTSEARYRGLFEVAGDAIVVLDAAGVIREAHPRLGELLGRPSAGLIGHAFREFYPPLSRGAAGLESTMTGAHAAAMRGDRGHVALRLVRADGRLLEVDVSFARFEDGGAPMVQAIVRDLTERRLEERRQVEAQRFHALARLAGGLAHQFNNILGGILTHAAVLREEADEPAARTAADEVLAAARRGRDLTKELSAFTRQGEVAPRPVPAAEIVASLSSLARATLPPSIALVTDVAEGLPPALADADQLVQAGAQLLRNALDAMRDRMGDAATLTLGAALADVRTPPPAAGRYVRFFVRDTGAGMDPVTLEHAFEPFYTTKPLHQAAGLGLTEVRRIAEAHRGAVRIESAPDRGTTVHVLIPVAQSATPVTAAGRAAPGAAGAVTILVVDDEPVVRNSLRRALTRMGYAVIEAEDGPSALAALQAAQRPVDLVILDLVLPGGGAGIFELLTAVRPGLKVLVSSGYSPDTEAARGLASRAAGFLPKPYEMRELREAVARALAP